MQPQRPKQIVQRQWPDAASRPPSGRATNPRGRGPMGIPPKQENWFTKHVRIGKGHVLLAVAVFGVFAVCMAWSNAGIRSLEADLMDAKEQVAATYSELAEKERQLDFSGTEEYIEREARERFGYIMPGEIRYMPDNLYVNEDYPATSQTDAAPDGQAAAPDGMPTPPIQATPEPGTFQQVGFSQSGGQ